MEATVLRSHDELLRCVPVFRSGNDSKPLINRIVQFLVHLDDLTRLFEHQGVCNAKR